MCMIIVSMSDGTLRITWARIMKCVSDFAQLYLTYY
jgi:hypothetical protein